MTDNIDRELEKYLLKIGVDKNNVKLVEDYNFQHPTARLYRDLKSKKRFAVISALPRIDSNKIEWRSEDNFFLAANSAFKVIVNNEAVDVARKDESSSWSPQVFLNGKEISPESRAPASLLLDPENENYSHNVLEWDYGICKRRLRLIEGAVLEYYIFEQDPRGDVVIKSNLTGDLKPASYYAIDDNDDELEGLEVIGNEKKIPVGAFKDAVYPVTIDDSFLSSISDGYIKKEHATYSTARDGPGHTIVDDTDSFQVGQWRSGGTPTYKIRRGFLFFNTSLIPANAVIQSAVLSLYGKGKWAQDGDWDIVIQHTAYANIYPHDPLELIDYNRIRYSGNDGSINTSDFIITDYNDIVLNSDGRSWIKKGAGAKTKWALQSSKDIDGTAPTAYNYVNIWSAEKGNGYQPKLVVEYYVGATRPLVGGSLVSGNPLIGKGLM